MDCCGGYDEVFTERAARMLRRRFDRRGLRGPGREMVRWLDARGLVEGARVLEIGGGLGELQVELLRRGAAEVTNVELVRSYETEAARLLADQHLTGRVERVVGDLVVDPGLAGEADVVVLNRVVCCYPDAAGLLAAAGERASKALVLSHPPRTLLVRAGLAVLNSWERLRGRDYRAWAHPPAQMLAVLATTGLRPAMEGRAGVWRIQALERVTTRPGAATTSP